VTSYTSASFRLAPGAKGTPPYSKAAQRVTFGMLAIGSPSHPKCSSVNADLQLTVTPWQPLPAVGHAGRFMLPFYVLQ
jgi:hypothetical protein